MSINIGDNANTYNIALGNTDAKSVYLGSTLVWPFTPSIIVNQVVTNAAVPALTTGCYVTLIGGGGGGGGANKPSSGGWGGGGGGGGGAISRIFIPVASLGSTYSVTRGSGGGGGSNSPTNGTAGGSSTFTSGSVTLTATGGGGGVAGGSGASTGGTAGGYSISGGTFTYDGVENGGAGGIGGRSGNLGGNAGGSTTYSGPGGGGGGANSSLAYAGSAGGSSGGASGGAGGSGSGNAGGGGGYARLGMPGGGGGGGAGASGFGATAGAGGAGSAAGAGGGGSGGKEGILGNGNSGGAGAAGLTVVEWVGQTRPKNYLSTGAGAGAKSGTRSWSHSVPASATAAVVWINATFTNSTNSASVTFGGVSMTNVVNTQFASGGFGFPFYYYKIIGFILLNPPTGNVTVSTSLSGGDVWQVGNSVAYRNVGSYTTPVTYTSGSGTGVAIEVSGIHSTDIVSQAFVNNIASGSGFTSYNQTQRYSINAVNDTYGPLLIGDATDYSASALFTANQASSNYAAGGIILQQ